MIKAIFTFDSFILPKIVTVIYWIGLALIVLLSLSGPFLLTGLPVQALVTGYGPPAWLLSLVIILSLLGGAILALLWRLLLEVWIVQFSIHNVLRDIRDQRGSA